MNRRSIFLSLAIVLLLSTVAFSADMNDVRRHFTEKQVNEARSFAFSGRLLYLLSTILDFSLLIILLFWVGRPLKNLCRRISTHYLLVVLMFSAAFILLQFLVNIPMGLLYYWRGKAWGLTTMGMDLWATTRLKTLILSLMFMLPAFVGLYYAISKFPRCWWIPVWAVSLFFSVLMTFLAPVIITPLFNTFKPIDDGSLRTGILALGEKADLEVGDVLVSDASRYSKRVNAYFIGLGSSKRIVLYDTLTDNYSEAEILSVVAHEMGHWKFMHILKGIAIGTILSLVGIFLLYIAYSRLSVFGFAGLEGQDDIRGLPLIMLLVFFGGFLILPLQNSISRYYERQSDYYSLELTNDAGTFISMERKLALSNMSDPLSPWLMHWWLGSHPRPIERIIMAEKYMIDPESVRP